MKKNTLVVAAVLFSVLLLSPIALANVYVPPGPPLSMDAWITPTLRVFDWQDTTLTPIGWVYSDGPMYDNVLQETMPKIEKEFPRVIGEREIRFSTWVLVFGWIPKVYVSPDQVPPDVEIVITWNGIPYLKTLKLPATQIVGTQYPYKLYPDIKEPYEFTFPDDPPNPDWKYAYYNIWFGDIDTIRDQLAFDLPDIDYPAGLFFWYKFHPNTGDWIAFDCQPGETKHPPTYDITALFEYSTSQIWFNHVAFDVRFLEVHKTIKPNPILNAGTITGLITVMDEIKITNVGKVPATKLDLSQSFPSNHEVGVMPRFGTAVAKIIDEEGDVVVPTQSLPNFGMPYDLPPPFDTLKPLETMIINMEIGIALSPMWHGTIVFDLVVSAWEIPEWKYPRSMDGLIILSAEGPGEMEPLFRGWKLELVYPREGMIGRWWFHEIDEWFVPSPVIREEPPQMLWPDPPMKLDPVPVDLNGDGRISAADVAIVRQAIVGLRPFDPRMDINGNGKIDTQDLAAYKLAVNG